MKKYIAVLTAICLCAGLCSPILAKPGDVAGAVLYSDIRADIDGVPIASYNINGYTAVCAEDLAAYGFSVLWVPGDRRLQIHLFKKDPITAEYTHPEVTVPSGTWRMPYLETDIVTSVQGNAVPGYNVGGRTLVFLDDMTSCGYTTWDPAARTISFTRVAPWSVIYPEAASPVSDAQKAAGATSFDLTFSRGEDGKFRITGENAGFISSHNVGWYFGAKGGSAQFSLYQNDVGLGAFADALRKCVTYDQREMGPVDNSIEEIAKIAKITVNGEEKTVTAVSYGQGNGHIDFLISFEGSYPEESVHTAGIRLDCAGLEK